MQAPRPTPSSGRDTPWSSTVHGKTPALPRCPTPQPPRSTLGSCAPRHSGDPWGMPGALDPPAATVTGCAAAWACVGPRLWWAGRGAAAGTTTLEPPVGAQWCRNAPPDHHAHGGFLRGCCWGVHEPPEAAAPHGGWARRAAVVPLAARCCGSTGRARCRGGCGMAAQGSGLGTAAVSVAKCRHKRAA